MDTIEELVDEIQAAESTVKEVVKTPRSNTDDITAKRAELIRLSEDGEIDQGVKYLQKASAKVIEKLYKQMEDRRMEKANAFITDMIISKFSDMLGGLSAIESSESLNTELQKDKLLKGDVEKVVAMITPYIPALGIVSGGITVGKHVGEKYYNGKAAAADAAQTD